MNLREQLMENMPLAFIIFKIVPAGTDRISDYILIDANIAFERTFNCRKTDIIGKTMMECFPASSSAKTQLLSAFSDLRAGENRGQFKKMLHFNGRLYKITALVPDPAHLAVFFRDTNRLRLSKSKLAHNRVPLEKSAALAHRIFHNSPVSIVVYRIQNEGLTGMDYIVQYANPMAIKTEGWENINFVGRPVAELRQGIDAFGILETFQQVHQTAKTAIFPAQIYREKDKLRWVDNVVYKLPTGEIVAAYHDITDKVAAQQQLSAEKEKMKVTLYSIGDAVITTDQAGFVEIMNPIAEKLTGWSQNDAKGEPLGIVFDTYDKTTGQPAASPVEQVLRENKIVSFADNKALLSKTGVRHAITDSAAPITNSEGEILGVVLVFRDITELLEEERKIKVLSYQDALTGLYNRAYFRKEIARLDNEDHLPLTFIMSDIDGLKLINDVFGHLKGDEALVRAANIIRTACRSTDLICRLSGDEFVIVLPNTSLHLGQKICDRIKEASSKTQIANTLLSISLGCATKTHSEQRWQRILKSAEDNMYQSKFLGAKGYRSTILSSLKNSLFEKSHETKDHGERLGLFSRQIGKSMGLSHSKLDELELLGMLHDIGKIAIDDQILGKTTKLDKAEQEEMAKHPEIGYRIAQMIPELVNIADHILAHHERWDGKGYPRGLAGTQIPLPSRILAVADAYDAMTQDRPYRKAMSSKQAVQELMDNAGTQFDPAVVETFVKHLQGGHI